MKKSFIYAFMAVLSIALFSINSTLKITKLKSNQEPNSPRIIANHFDFPVGKPDAKGYYNAQPFGNNNHLGDDWNGNGGGNTDLGDTVYAIANGYITHAKDVSPTAETFGEGLGGGWGNVVRLTHHLTEKNTVESLYAHFNEILIDSTGFVKIGTPIGTIGTAGGIYPAHLHFEMRDKPNMPIGAGYARDKSGYINPTEFINSHR